MTENLMRRRLLGSHKVATPTFYPESGDYEFQSGQFQVTISCATTGSVIEYWAEINNTIIVSGTSSSNSVTININANYGETVIVHAIGHKDFYHDSDEAIAHYYNSARPEAPVLTLYASDDGCGNNYREVYIGNSPYTPASVKITNPSPDEYGKIYYTFTTDGTTPADPTTNPSGISNDDSTSVKWDLSSTYPYTILTSGTYTVSAAIKVGNVFSQIVTETYYIGQSICVPNPIYNTDYIGSVGAHTALNIDGESDSTWSNGRKHQGQVNVDTVNHQIISGSIPQYYGFAICAPYDTDEYKSKVFYTLNGTNVTTTSNEPLVPGQATYSTVGISPNGFVVVNRNFQLKWRMEKLGCTPVDNYSQTDSNGTQGIGQMMRVNRMAMKVTVTDLSKPVFIGRRYVWIDGGNEAGNNFGEYVSKAPHTSDYTMSYNLQYAYDVPENTSDWETAGGACIRVYANGTRIMPSDMTLTNKQCWRSDCPIYHDSSGTEQGDYMNQTDLDITSVNEQCYYWTPPATGTYEIVYSWPERIRWSEEKEVSGQTQHAYHTDFCNCPYGFLSTCMHEGLVGNLNPCPTDINITDGMSVIPRWFASNIRGSGNLRFHFDTDLAPDQIYSYIKLVKNSGSALTRILDYAFSGSRPYNSGNSISIDLSEQKSLVSIGKYVFFDCVKNLNWSNPQQTISSIHVPSGVTNIGYFFNGFNCMESCLDNGVEKSSCGLTTTFVIYRSGLPPEIGISSYTSSGCHAQPWTNSNYDTYISYTGVDLKQWNVMSFGYMVWRNPSTPDYYYHHRMNSASKIKVPDAYVCPYTEKWGYQRGTDPETPMDRKAVYIPIVGITDGYTCYGHHDTINYPTGSIGGRFTYSEPNDGFSKKLCFSKGNLMYMGSNSNTWSFHTQQYDVCSEANNESTASTTQRDMFAYATSGINHGTYNPQWESLYPGESNAPHYNPWQFADGNQYHYCYSYPWLNLSGNSITSYRPKYNHNGYQADWAYNAIENGGNTAGQWKTISKDVMNYILRSRKTRYGYRFTKAKVGSTYGLLILPDDWDKSVYALTNINKEDWVAYSANSMSESTFRDTLQTHGVVFLPAKGFLNNSGNLSDKDNGYYWFCNPTYESGYYPGQITHLYFSGSSIDPDGLNLASYIERQKGCFVRPYRLVEYTYIG